MIDDGPVGIGIIGFGGFGQFLARSWSEMRSVSVRAVADTNSDLAPPKLRFYVDWRQLLADPDVEVVSIATPPSTHCEMACAAMRAGKHILIEKPLATTLDGADRILAVQQETGRIVGVDYMLRFNPIVEAMQKWSKAGFFGRLRRVVVENYAQDEALPADHWFWDREISGGILVEHAVHFVDVVHGCTDAEARSVDGYGLIREDGRMDRMGLTAIYDDEVVMQQYHAFSRPGFFEDTSMRFVFDLAQVEVEGWIPLKGRVAALVSDESERSLHRLPGLSIEERTSVQRAEDSSRPEGWGPVSRSEIRSGGVAYGVDELVRGSFTLAAAKSEAYASALRSTMADLVTAIRNPAHRLRAGLPEGVRSLRIASEATSRALARQESS